MTRRPIPPRSLRDERGGIIVLAALLTPIFLLITALVIDVGNWYTHQRQLQNRADAAALAAGVAYRSQWPECINDANAEAVITAAARQFSGDPTATSPQNTEVANQANFDVRVNSTGYPPPAPDAGIDFSDGGGPCFDHPANGAPEGEDNITPTGGFWTDVKVKERNLGSLFGAFGIDLLRVRARARVELKEAAEGDQFVPIAVPEQSIAKAEVVFWNECTGQRIDVSGRQSTVMKPITGESGLWGPDPSGVAPSVSPGTVSVPIPASVSGCSGTLDHVPIGVEVRLAGRPDINLGPYDAARCAQLQAGTSTDCFRHVSRIRVYEPTGGLVGDRPQIRNVILSPTNADCGPDAYYARLALGSTGCRVNVSAEMDWGGDRVNLGGTFEATAQVGGGAAGNLSGTVPTGTWTGAADVDELGPSDVTINWEWRYRGPGTFDGQNCNRGQGCRQSGSIDVHQVNLADDPSGNNDSPSDTVTAVKLTSGPYDPSGSNTEVHSSVVGNGAFAPYLTLGLKSAYAPGDFAVLRLRSGQRNFSVICDPYWPQPSSQDASAAFYFGCQPPYGNNDTTQTGFWWGPGCPAANQWFSVNGAYPNQSYPNGPWKCVQLDVGGNGFTIDDGIALRTGNCETPNVDSQPGPGAHADCQGHRYVCNNPILYNGGTDFPTADDPRVVKLYVVPYQAYKGVQSGNGQVVPVLKLAAFYITAWKYNNRGEPCNGGSDGGFPNDNNKLGGEMLGGYFIKLVDEKTGPINPTRNCNPDDINLCTVALTR